MFLRGKPVSALLEGVVGGPEQGLAVGTVRQGENWAHSCELIGYKTYRQEIQSHGTVYTGGAVDGQMSSGLWLSLCARICMSLHRKRAGGFLHP